MSWIESKEVHVDCEGRQWKELSDAIISTQNIMWAKFVKQTGLPKLFKAEGSADGQARVLSEFMTEYRPLLSSLHAAKTHTDFAEWHKRAKKGLDEYFEALKAEEGDTFPG